METHDAFAFRIIYEASEILRKRGIVGAETWQCMFAMLQDLQAADLGMGSDEHREEVEAMHDDLARTLADWDEPVLKVDNPQ